MTVNRKTVGTAIGKHFREGIEADYPDFPVLGTEIGQYVAFAEALTTGKIVMGIDAKGTAAKQIDALADEIRKVLSDEQKDTRTRKAALR